MPASPSLPPQMGCALLLPTLDPVSRSLLPLAQGQHTVKGTMKVTTVKMSSGLPIPVIEHRDAAGSAQRCTRSSTSANTSRCSASCKGWQCAITTPLLILRLLFSHLLPKEDQTPCPPLLAPLWKHHHGFRSCLLSSGCLQEGGQCFTPPTEGKGLWQGGKEGLEAFSCCRNGIMRTLCMWKHL